MNGSTVRKLLKYGYSCSKELLVQPSSSRILCSYPTERRYLATCPQSNGNINLLQSKGSLHHHWNNNSLLNISHRYLSTTSLLNGQTAPKLKSAQHGNNNKPAKESKTKNDDEKHESHHKDNENDKAAEKTAEKDEAISHTEEKLSLTARFKKMYKDYWYVLLPVHVVTSSCWLAGFYYLSTSGVDIPSVLEQLHVSETVISKLRDSSMGNAAIAYLCYKIATPLRYTVTLGGTTLSIKYLSQWGYIRPVPSKEKLKEMYEDQKAKFHKKD